MDTPTCIFCGSCLRLEVNPDKIYYEQSIKSLKKDDPRFKGETYRYICPKCQRRGAAAHRDNYPDMLNHVKTPDEARAFALWTFENSPDN